MRFLNIHAIALIGAYAAYLVWYFATVPCRHVSESGAPGLCPSRTTSSAVPGPASFSLFELLVHLSVTPSCVRGATNL